jgi:hypothetical protein
MILRLLCIWLVFYSLLSSLMHGTMNLNQLVNVVVRPTYLSSVFRQFVQKFEDKSKGKRKLRGM